MEREVSEPLQQQQQQQPAVCEKCHGTGWEIIVEGNISRARRCPCSKVTEGDRIFAAAKIPPKYVACDFDNYVPQNATGQAIAKNMAMAYALDYPLLDDTFHARGLLFVGGVGRGKTHLAVAVLKTLLKKGFSCLFVDFHELLADIRGSYDTVSQTSEYEILKPVIHVEVLLMDDLGSQRMTDWMQDTVFHIINLRYGQNRPTIITTNLGLEPVKSQSEESLQDRLGQRVVSRLYEMCTRLDLDGSDYRKDVRKAGADLIRQRKQG